MDCSKPIFKRVKERSVWEAKQSVDQWRKLFNDGLIDASGNKIKFTLQQAAEQVGIPKKTLEDYHQLLRQIYFRNFLLIVRKVEKITPLENLKDKKMGFLRQFLKENKSKLKLEADDIEFPQQIQQVDPQFTSPTSEFYLKQDEEQPQVEAFEQQELAQAHNNWEEMIIEGDIQQQHDWDESNVFQPRQQCWDGEEMKDQSFFHPRMQYYQPNQFNYSTPYVSFVFLPDFISPISETVKDPLQQMKFKMDQLYKSIIYNEEEEINADRETSPDDDDYQNSERMED